MKEKTLLLIKEAEKLISMMDVDAIFSGTPKGVTIETGNLKVIVTSKSILIHKG